VNNYYYLQRTIVCNGARFSHTKSDHKPLACTTQCHLWEGVRRYLWNQCRNFGIDAIKLKRPLQRNTSILATMFMVPCDVRVSAIASKHKLKVFVWAQHWLLIQKNRISYGDISTWFHATSFHTVEGAVLLRMSAISQQLFYTGVLATWRWLFFDWNQWKNSEMHAAMGLCI